jgi:hypothetical protein
MDCVAPPPHLPMYIMVSCFMGAELLREVHIQWIKQKHNDCMRTVAHACSVLSIVAFCVLQMMFGIDSYYSVVLFYGAWLETGWLCSVIKTKGWRVFICLLVLILQIVTIRFVDDIETVTVVIIGVVTAIFCVYNICLNYKNRKHRRQAGNCGMFVLLWAEGAVRLGLGLYLLFVLLTTDQRKYEIPFILFMQLFVHQLVDPFEDYSINGSWGDS